eukprot:196895-Amphidinium_carterae.1
MRRVRMFMGCSQYVHSCLGNSWRRSQLQNVHCSLDVVGQLPVQKTKKSIVWGTPGGGINYRMFIGHGTFAICSFKNAVKQNSSLVFFKF